MRQLIRDINNYFYTQNRFRDVLDHKPLRRYELKLSPIGVLYCWRKFPVGTPEQYLPELLVGDLEVLDTALTSLNLDGIVRMETRSEWSDEDNLYILVKFVPVWNVTRWYFISRFVLLVLFGLGLWYWWPLWSSLGVQFSKFLASFRRE